MRARARRPRALLPSQGKRGNPMNIIQILLIAVGLMSFMVLGYLALSGPSAAKESQRRLQAVRTLPLLWPG